MTDYVLMPEEATPEMEQAAEKYWNDRKFKALSDDPRTWKGLYAAMRAVAPAVQREPVSAQVRYRRPEKGQPGWSVWQPAAVMLDRPSWEIDSQGWEVEYRLLYTAPQPSPDVTQLVEALARCRHEASYSIGEEEALSIQLGKVRDIVNQTLSALAPYRKGGGK